jgi:hypothetical protein
VFHCSAASLSAVHASWSTGPLSQFSTLPLPLNIPYCAPSSLPQYSTVPLLHLGHCPNLPLFHCLYILYCAPDSLSHFHCFAASLHPPYCAPGSLPQYSIVPLSLYIPYCSPWPLSQFSTIPMPLHSLLCTWFTASLPLFCCLSIPPYCSPGSPSQFSTVPLPLSIPYSSSGSLLQFRVFFASLVSTILTFIDMQVRLVRLQTGNFCLFLRQQTDNPTNFHLHNEQMVNG